ncbi:MAG: hypothetical protein ACRD3Z_00190, partial [Nitrososphaerales archaeon]
MKSEIDYGKIIAIGLVALLTTAILSTSALNTFSEEDDDNDNNDSKEEQEEEHEEETDTETQIEVKAETVGNSTMVKVEIEFTSNSTSKESLLKDIMTNIRLSNETISNILQVETYDDENEDEEMKEKEKPRVKIEMEDGTAEVEFKYKFMVNATQTDDIVAAIADELQNLELDVDDIELKMEKEGKPEIKKEFKVKDAEIIAKKAKEDAEKTGKHEFVENIDKAEKYFGKLDKAVVALKIGLESDDIESTSFGSAQLILVKIGNNEPVFRAVVNILTDQPIDTLTACLDGNSIGQLTIVHTSNELGLSIGHLKETLTGSSITVPGVT